jgi:hypothetical protein
MLTCDDKRDKSDMVEDYAFRQAIYARTAIAALTPLLPLRCIIRNFMA